MEIRSEVLTKNQLKKELNFIISFCKEQKRKFLTVWYGWECDTENLYTDKKIPISSLIDFINTSNAKGIYHLGSSDLGIDDPQKKFNFMLCHESDIHFSTTQKKLMKDVEIHWQSVGHKFYKIKKK